jgi:hypothetical protein
LLFEREQLPQVIDNKHFRIELIEFLEPVIVLRNQQVAGSIPAGGSISLIILPLLVYNMTIAVLEITLSPSLEIHRPIGLGIIASPGGYAEC